MSKHITNIMYKLTVSGNKILICLFQLEVNILDNLTHLLPIDHVVFYIILKTNLSLTDVRHSWLVESIMLIK